MISTRKAAEMLGVSVRTVQLWVEAGVLKAWKTAGNHRRIFVSSVEDLISQREQRAPCVLIVEDDATLCAFYESLFDLVEPQVSIEFAVNGFEGLVKLGDVKPQLMIVDVDLPGMDGLAMLRSMQSSDAVSDVHIVIVTSLDARQLADRGGVPEGIECYEKPLRLDDFKRIVAKLPGPHKVESIEGSTP